MADGRVALVTGGARGIGRGIALRLAADGFAVAIGDLNTDGAEAVASEAGGRAMGVHLDVTSADATTAAVAAVTDQLGPIEVLVNNAGWDEMRRFVDTDEEQWDKVIAINYKVVLRTTHAILPGMIERGFGRIVNIGSDAGRVGSSMESVYAGCKGAVIAFTKTIAREAARQGVTANVVCPGPTAPRPARGHRRCGRVPRPRRRCVRHRSDTVGQRRPDDGLASTGWPPGTTSAASRSACRTPPRPRSGGTRPMS
jgi:2-hydroxycyclohexanecarboxyl-CoA dehydrogenase